MPPNNSDKRFFESLAAGQQTNKKPTNQKPNIDELREGTRRREEVLNFAKYYSSNVINLKN